MSTWRWAGDRQRALPDGCAAGQQRHAAEGRAPARVAAAPPPTIIGIDDRAWRRNHRYGTIICKLERCRPSALLPDHEAASAQGWLAAQPRIALIAQNRGGPVPVSRPAQGPNDRGTVTCLIIKSASEPRMDADPRRGTRRDVAPGRPILDSSPFAQTLDLADGVMFSGCDAQNQLIGVMGLQRRQDVDLIRHAYVLPEWQGHGIGARLLGHLCHYAERPIPVGTWAVADWAIRFYKRQGFALAGEDDIAPLLRTYWNVPERQIATSVVLSSPALASAAAKQLIVAERSTKVPN